MPSNGFYTFTAADQWAKTFSKGFVIKKAWSYVLKVYDSLSDSLVGTLPITVWSSSSSGTVALDKAIQIQEPLSWATIQSSAVNVIGLTAVSYTHLDVYKRQLQESIPSIIIRFHLKKMEEVMC